MFDKSEQWYNSSLIDTNANFIRLVKKIKTFGTTYGAEDKPDSPEVVKRIWQLLYANDLKIIQNLIV